MTFTNEQMNKAKQAKTAEELLAMAKANGITLTEDEAKKYFAELHREGELSDDELNSVAGGKGEPDPKFAVNDRVMYGTYQDYWVYRTTRHGTISEAFYVNGQWHYMVTWDDGVSNDIGEDSLLAEMTQR